MEHYRAFGLSIRSELKLASFPSTLDEGYDCLVSLGEGPPNASAIELDEVGRLSGVDGRELWVNAAPGSDPQLVAATVETLGLAALLAQRGLVTLHASALAFGEGTERSALLLVGGTGHGKSTLAAALVRHGLTLLGDDPVALERGEGNVLARPTGVGLQLWPDALERLAFEPSRRLRGDRGKCSAAVRPEGIALPVRMIVFLPEPGGTDLALSLLRQEQAYAEVLPCVFRQRQLKQSCANVLAALVRTAFSFLLRRPRDARQLDDTCALIIRNALELPPPRRRTWAQLMLLPPFSAVPSEAATMTLGEGRQGYLLLASYPKSGNTWVRALLTAWRLGERPPLAALDNETRFSTRHDLGEASGLDPDLLTQDELGRARGRLLRERAALFVGTAPLKVHERFLGAALFPPEAVAAVVHVVRNPLDVAVSLSHHLSCTPARAAEVLGNADNWFSADPREWEGWAASAVFPQSTGSWSEHTLSWLEAPGYRHILVRYEDLLADAARELRRILELVDIPWDEERGARAVSQCAFKELQKAEAARGFHEKPAPVSAFFRKGLAGEWRHALSPEIAERVCADHAAVMARLGYELFDFTK